MIIPAQVLVELDSNTRHDFLEHLVLSSMGADSFEGDLEAERTRLERSLLDQEVFVEQFEDNGVAHYRLLTRDEARGKGVFPA